MKDAQGKTFTLDSATMHWNPDSSLIQLKGNSSVESESFGLLTCDKEVSITLQENHAPTFIKATGKILFQHPEYIVECMGKMEFDPSLNSLTATGETTPVICSKGALQIETKSVSTNTLASGKEKAYHLEGPIIIKHPLFNVEADSLSFDPITRSIELSSNNKIGLIISDSNKLLTMSAESLKISKDPESQVEILGKGRIRFTFEKENIPKLHQVMHLCLSHLF